MTKNKSKGIPRKPGPNWEKEAKAAGIKLEAAEADNRDLKRQLDLAQAEIKGLQWQYLAMGPHCWGRGDTYEQAVERCKAQWPGGLIPKGTIKVIKGRDLKIDKLGRVTGRDAESVAEFEVLWSDINPDKEGDE